MRKIPCIRTAKRSARQLICCWTKSLRTCRGCYIASKGLWSPSPLLPELRAHYGIDLDLAKIKFKSSTPTPPHNTLCLPGGFLIKLGIHLSRRIQVFVTQGSLAHLISSSLRDDLPYRPFNNNNNLNCIIIAYACTGLNRLWYRPFELQHFVLFIILRALNDVFYTLSYALSVAG